MSECKFNFRTYEKVLVRENKDSEWRIDFFGMYDEKRDRILCLSGTSNNKTLRECIHYEGNEHLLGTTEPYVEPKFELEIGETYYYPMTKGCFSSFEPMDTIYRGSDIDEELIKRKWAFYTKKECKVFCGKLNEAVKNVK